MVKNDTSLSKKILKITKYQKAATFKIRGKTSLALFFLSESQSIQTNKPTNKNLTSFSFFPSSYRLAAWVAATHAGVCALGVKGQVNGEITDDSVWWVL